MAQAKCSDEGPGIVALPRKKVAFFTPHAGIWPHALPESYLAKALNSEDFEVSRIMCDGTFQKHCTVMEAMGIGIESDPGEKQQACKRCIANSGLLRGAYRGRNLILSGYLGEGDAAKADAISGSLKEVDIRELTFMGVEVGKIASYEVLLKFKKTSLEFNGEEFEYFKTYVRNSLLSLMAFSRIYEESRPDVLIAYSPQYSVCGVAARYCELNGSKVYFIEGSSNIEERYKALRVWDWSVFGLTNPALKYWPKVDAYALSSDDYERVERHTSRLLDASSFSVYSEPVSGSFDMRTHFGVPPGAKVVLAAMSSYDEVFSAYVIERFPANKYISSVFKGQLEWIKGTIDFFSTHPELFLVIRIHPRTFPSKRNSVMAAEQVELAKILSELPSNVKANYPTDKISIYDLYKQIDALTTGWSATGVEAMTFGVPVITYDRNLPSYPASIHYTGDSKEEYYANLIKATAAGKKGQSVVDGGLAWMAFSMSAGVVLHPAMLNDLETVRRNKVCNFLYRGLNRLAPSLIKRVEAARSIGDSGEIRRFNDLIRTAAPSLYDVPRTPGKA